MHLPLMLNCREASRLASESLDRRLPLTSRIRLRLHLMMCHYCRRFSAQMRMLKTWSLRIDLWHQDRFPEAQLSETARARIRQALKHASAAD
jgi:hypothetical protein